jgi:hypothetical protein
MDFIKEKGTPLCEGFPLLYWMDVLYVNGTPSKGIWTTSGLMPQSFSSITIGSWPQYHSIHLQYMTICLGLQVFF